MKKILNVNIGSQAFAIDDDAYHMLGDYFCDVRSRLKDSDCQNVMDDVEARAADVFRNATAHSSQIVDQKMVAHAISTIGAPHTFGYRRHDYTPPFEEGWRARRLYRSRTNFVISGVCGGLAKYFNLDPTIVRIATVLSVALAGFGFWLYIILWIVVPREPIENVYGRR